jgi:hypothetical protein
LSVQEPDVSDEIEITPDSFEAAANGLKNALEDMKTARRTYNTVMDNLGDFLGNDDAGKQLKSEYDPAHTDFQTVINKLLDEDLPTLEASLRADAQSWRNADTAKFGD